MRATLVPQRIPFPSGAAPRTPGVHLSGLLKSMAVEYGFLDKQWVDDLKLVEVEGSGEAWWNALDDASQIRMALGLAWEQWYLPQIPGVLHQPGELNVEGIYMSRDGESLDVVMAERKQTHIIALHECKVTSKSINTVGDLNASFFNPKNWLWTTQIACYCVHADTRILTSDLTWERAGELPAGSGLFAFEEHPAPHGGRRWKKAAIEMNREVEKPCFEVVLDDGTEVICSHDHQWLTKADGSENSLAWVRADKLFARDEPKSRRKVDRLICKPLDVWDTPTDYDSGWLAGMFDGEGCICLSNGHMALSLSQKEGPVLQRVRDILTAKGIQFTESVADKRSTKAIHIRTQSGVLECLGRVRPGRLLNKFREFPWHSEASLGGPNAVGIKRRRDIGNQKVRLIQTTGRTFLANGLASHNCYGMGTTVAYLHILYLYGDYTRPYRQVLHVWRLEFAETELATIWRRVRDYRDECAAKGVLG